MNKVAYLKRTQTAGNGFRQNQEKDIKSQTFTKITYQQEEEASLNKQLQILHTKRDEIKSQIEAKEKQIEEKRKQIFANERNGRWGENKPQKSSQSQLDKKLKMRRQPQNIQFNLAYLYQKENEMLNETVQLKNDINKMRREKEMFKKILKQLQEDWIAHHEKTLERSQEQEKAFQSLHSEMNTIKKYKQQEVQEFRKFGKEFRSVYDKFKESKSPQNELQTKSREKSRNKKGYDPISNRYKIDSDGKEYSGSEEDPDMEELKYEILHINETADKKKKKMLEKEQKAQQNQQEQQALQALQQEVQTYDTTLKQLYNQTKSEQIDDIVNIFVEQEEQNYGAFKYIYEQSDDLEMLQKQNKLLLIEKQELENRDQKIMADQKYKQKLQFEDKLVKIKSKQDDYQKILESIQKILKELMISIPIMFERIGCNLKEYSQLLGPKFSFKEMDEDKLLKVLGVIEIRTNDILQMQDIAQNPRHNFMKKESKQANFAKIDDGNAQMENPNDDQLQRILEKFKGENELSDVQFSKAYLRELAEKQIKAGTGKKKRN